MSWKKDSNGRHVFIGKFGVTDPGIYYLNQIHPKMVVKRAWILGKEVEIKERMEGEP